MNTMHTADPLSLLPEDLVQHILFFLPPRDVARTSILSKSWRIFWNFLPTQNFTLSYYHDDRREDSEATSKFIKFVDDSLQKLRGQIAKIKSFCLFISNYQQNLCSCMDDWIGLVTKNCIEELDICIFVISAEGVKRSVLPQATFLAKSLSVLRLQGFTLEDSLLRGDMMLPCLKILSLSHVHLSELMTEKLLSSCPSLEEFSLLTSSGESLCSKPSQAQEGLQFAEIKMTATSDLDISWFLKLNKYLGMFHKHDVLALVIHSDVITFNPEEWTDIYTPQPCNLDRIKIIHISSQFSATIQLFWMDYYVVLFQELYKSNMDPGATISSSRTFTNKEEIQQCSFNCNFLCWRHILKDVKIKTQSYSGTEAEVVEQKRVFESLQNLEYGEQVIFEFTW
ncbi:hypothetical protein GH714_035833 [Hevea brasiliensis]|uniref:F-box domain-containing protein n=1 Tax=Hevea brasiliensis TaxID=3981 RepID=A0A6A6ND45_HEVBR|nr:hypothetical protein GH714_035833 [Hevea brasiliensis]